MVPAPETKQAQRSKRELGTVGSEESVMLDLARARLWRAGGNSNTAPSCVGSNSKATRPDFRKQPSLWGAVAKEDELDHLLKLLFCETQR